MNKKNEKNIIYLIHLDSDFKKSVLQSIKHFNAGKESGKSKIIKITTTSKLT